MDRGGWVLPVVVLAVLVAVAVGLAFTVGLLGSGGEAAQPTPDDGGDVTGPDDGGDVTGPDDGGGMTGPDDRGQYPRLDAGLWTRQSEMGGGNTDDGGSTEVPDWEFPIAPQSGEFTPPDPETSPGTLNASHGEFAEFVDVTDEVGLEYETEATARIIAGSQGAYVVDFNNNGYEDLLLTGGEHPVLFENTRNGTYEVYREFDHTDTTAAHFLDYNNNGFRDLLLASPGTAPVLYENVEGEFVRRDVGFDPTGGFPFAVTSADITGNGCLDLYMGVYGITDGPLVSPEGLIDVGKHHPEVRPTTDNATSNVLYAGDCESFEDITESAGVGGSEVPWSVSAADFTGNGHVDIHVANDWSRDFLYENQGNGSFEERDMGLASDRNAMSSTAMDVTGNHRLDIFVTNVYFEGGYDVEELVPVTRTPLPLGNNLFANEGNGEFHDIAPEHGLHRGSWGWATTIADYTNDGHLDVIHASSFSDPAVVEDQPAIFEPPQIWKGTADSWEKVDGYDLGFPKHDIQSAVRVDYQNDGTLDFVTVGNPPHVTAPGGEPVANANRPFLHENQLDSNESLQLWVRNPDGLERNAEVYIETSERTIYREANARADFLSQDSRLLHVGTANEAIERVVVVWPDGTTTGYETLTAGDRYIVTPDGAQVVE